MYDGRNFSCKSIKKKTFIVEGLFFLNIAIYFLHQICLTIVRIELIMY
jgi:hypothetical protein